YGDLAIGGPYEDVEAIDSAGAVNVIYGSAGGLSATAVPDQFWSQASFGVEEIAEAGAQFGAALACGDFNNDGYADLAVGVPYESVGDVSDAGGVNVIYGSAGGLS